MDPQIAALFPDRLVESELGEIPEGWDTGQFDDMARQLKEKVNPLKSPDTIFHHYSIPAYDNGQNPKPEGGEHIKSMKSRVHAGIILLSKLNPEIERVWLVDVRPDDNAICSTEFMVLTPIYPCARSYLYCLLRSPSFRGVLEGIVTGTSRSHQRIQANSIPKLAIIRPTDQVLCRFEKMIEPALASTLASRRETQTLTELRDALLPKLISGELRVGDFEKSAREAS